MSSITEKRGGFKVVIVGGGVAGLTLANCLERAGSKFKSFAFAARDEA